MKIDAATDRRLIRAEAESVRYVRVSLVAPPSPRRAERWPVNVALVLDRSGSMGGRKIQLAREATAQALRLLRADDRFALVVYDNEVTVLSDSVEATPEAKRRALAPGRDRCAGIDGSRGRLAQGCREARSYARCAIGGPLSAPDRWPGEPGNHRAGRPGADRGRTPGAGRVHLDIRGG